VSFFRDQTLMRCCCSIAEVRACATRGEERGEVLFFFSVCVVCALPPSVGDIGREACGCIRGEREGERGVAGAGSVLNFN